MKDQRGRRPSPPGRGVRYETSRIGTKRDEPPLDLAIAELAARQHGVVSLGQLQFAGLTAGAARKRVAAGRLHRVHHGVFAVGHRRLTGRGRSMAAVLSYGPLAVLSHRSAAGLWGLLADNRARTDI